MDYINKIISVRRKELGMTQAELAQRLNISDKTVSKWETGSSLPDLSLIKAISEVLKISVSQLMGEATEQNQQANSINIESIIEPTVASLVVESAKEEKALETKIVVLLKLQRLIEFAFMFAIALLFTIPHIVQLIHYLSDSSIAVNNVYSNSFLIALILWGLISAVYVLLMILTFIFYKPGVYKNKFGSLFYFYSIALFLLIVFLLVANNLFSFNAGGLILDIIKTIIFIASITLPFLPFFVAKKRGQELAKDKKNKILFIIAAIMLVLHLSIPYVQSSVQSLIINSFNFDSNFIMSSAYKTLQLANTIFYLLDGVFISVATICHFSALKRIR